jgi:hypothetical protein
MAYMPKLSFSEDNSHIILTVPTSLRQAPFIELVYEAATDLEAELLRDRLENEFHDHIEKVRRYEYERGWADAKAHKAKSLPRTCTLWLPEKK